MAGAFPNGPLHHSLKLDCSLQVCAAFYGFATRFHSTTWHEGVYSASPSRLASWQWKYGVVSCQQRFFTVSPVQLVFHSFESRFGHSFALSTIKKQAMNLIWNFGPTITLSHTYQAEQNEYFTANFNDSKFLRIRTSEESNEPSTAQVLQGSEDPLGGWYSRAFGVKQPIYQLRISKKSRDWKITTYFEWDV